MLCTLASVLASAVGVLAVIHLYLMHRFTYWQRRGVPTPKPAPFVGHVGPIIFGSQSGIKALVNMATPFRDKGYCGLYRLWRPVLLIWDPKMVRSILCINFSSFHSHGQPADEGDPLSMNLFNLEGAQWRNMRRRLAPAFGLCKVREMVPEMRGLADDLVTALVAGRTKHCNPEVDVGRLLFRYTVDVIGRTLYGIDFHCMRDADDTFIPMARDIFGRPAGLTARTALQTVHPRLGRMVPVTWMLRYGYRHLVALLRDVIRRRKAKKIQRDDLMQLLLQLHREERARADPGLPPGITVAQFNLMLLGGLDNVSNSVAFILSRLAADQDLQDRVAAEVRDVLLQHGGDLSYDAVRSMDLVERTVIEGLRLWSPVGVLLRRCDETTRVGDVLVEKGTHVIIMVDMMNSDPKAFPDPDRFDPDRHTIEARALRHPNAMLPLSMGPRVCVAEQYALLEMKVVLAVLLRDLVFTPGPNYEHEVELDTKATIASPLNSFKLCVSARE